MQAVGYAPTARVTLLQAHHLLVERQRAHQRLAAMPRKEHLGRGLALDILAYETLQQFVGEHLSALVGIEVLLLKVIAIVATQVAGRSHRLHHDIHGVGERGGG